MTGDDSHHPYQEQTYPQSLPGSIVPLAKDSLLLDGYATFGAPPGPGDLIKWSTGRYSSLRVSLLGVVDIPAFQADKLGHGISMKDGLSPFIFAVIVTITRMRGRKPGPTAGECRRVAVARYKLFYTHQPDGGGTAGVVP